MIYVCVPVHNEARTVGALLWKVRKVMAEFGRDYRIVVLDDASTDDTAAALERYRDVLPLHVMRSPERIGYAAAVERLLRTVASDTRYPKRDAAVVIQADFSEDPADIVGLVKVLEGGADIVAGVPDAGVAEPPAVRWTRRLAPFLLGKLHRDLPVQDPLGGFRAYRIIVLKKLFRDVEHAVTTEGWAANVELLGRLTPHARRVEESPLHPRPDLRVRPSRFRPLPVLKHLWAVRSRAPRVEAA